MQDQGTMPNPTELWRAAGARDSLNGGIRGRLGKMGNLRSICHMMQVITLMRALMCLETHVYSEGL